MNKAFALFVLLLAAACTQGQSNLNFQIILTGPFYTPPVTNVTSLGDGLGLGHAGAGRFSFGVGLGCCIPVDGGIYGPARPGEDGPVIFGFKDWLQTIGVAPNPPYWAGTVVYAYGLPLSPPQLHQLQAGLWYVKLELAEFFDEPATLEARGQILLVPNEDADGDGVEDSLDLCTNTPPFTIVDARGCSLEQLCPCQAAWRSHGDYFRQLARVTASFVRDGIITRAERRRLLRQAALSDCGG